MDQVSPARVAASCRRDILRSQRPADTSGGRRNRQSHAATDLSNCAFQDKLFARTHAATRGTLTSEIDLDA